MKPSVTVLVVCTMVFMFNGTECKLTTRSSTSTTTQEGLINKIKSGLQMAGNVLGLDVTSSIAQLVANAFSKKHESDIGVQDGNGIFGKVLKMLTLDVSKIGAIVVNAFVFLAQLIQVSLLKKKPAVTHNVQEPRRLRDGTPYEWITQEENSPGLRELLEVARDDVELTERVIESVEGRSDCVRMLICRIEPIVKGMQKALRDRDTGEGENIKTEGDVNKGLRLRALFHHLPTVEEFKIRGKFCKERFGNGCSLLD